MYLLSYLSWSRFSKQWAGVSHALVVPNRSCTVFLADLFLSMSYVTNTGGDKYRGGYATSTSFSSEELRVATSTFENYISGTVLIVVLIFFTFLFITALTFMLMCYSRCVLKFMVRTSTRVLYAKFSPPPLRYLALRQPKSGFYNPPPPVIRYPRKENGGNYSTISTRHDYDSLQRAHAPSALSHAVSQQSEML